jgi:hypothetical protein
MQLRGIDVFDIFLEDIALDGPREGVVGVPRGVDRVGSPEEADLPGRLVTEIGSDSKEPVAAHYSEVGAALSVQRIANAVPEPEDTRPQCREVSGGRVIQMMQLVVTAGLQPVPGDFSQYLVSFSQYLVGFSQYLVTSASTW